MIVFIATQEEQNKLWELYSDKKWYTNEQSFNSPFCPFYADVTKDTFYITLSVYYKHNPQKMPEKFVTIDEYLLMRQMEIV